MDRNTADAARRTEAYRYADGFVEMAVGTLVVVLGLLFLAEAVVPTAPKSLAAVGLIVIATAGAWVAKRLVAAAKERHTYPRTGRVVYRQPSRGLMSAVWLLAAVVGAACAAWLAVNLRARPGIESWLPLLQGVCGAWMLLMVGRAAGLARLYPVAFVSVVAGGIASLSGLDATAGDALYFLAMGTAMLLSGVLARRSYLRQAPPAEEA